MADVTHESCGINWVWYHVYSLNTKHKEAHLKNSWREHKYDPPRNVGCPDRANAKSYAHIQSGYNISKWKKDGKPGGFYGCKDNYKRSPCIIVDGIKYSII